MRVVRHHIEAVGLRARHVGTVGVGAGERCARKLSDDVAARDVELDGAPEAVAKLQAAGFGIFIPVFFVASGVRFDLSALSIAQLYKERWTIENWWKWIKLLFKIKEPLGRSEHALPVQIVGAFVTDLLLRAFQQSSGFTRSLYEFVTRCQEVSLVPLTNLPASSALRTALEAILKLIRGTERPLQLAACW